MKAKEIELLDIVIINDTPVQCLSIIDDGVSLQDIHTKVMLTHVHLVDRLATKDETKWFCENTEHTHFSPPIRQTR